MTKTKKKPAPKAAQPRPPKFQPGDAVEFWFTESSDGVRPQGDAEVLKADDVTPKQRMYQLEVKRIVAGNPDALRNPSGELWAMDGELFRPGTRKLRESAAAFNAVTKEDIRKADVKPPPAQKKPPAGMPADFKRLKEETGGALLLFRNGKVYEAFNGDAAVVGKALRLKLGQLEEVAAVEVPVAGIVEARKKLVAAGHRVGFCEVSAREAGGHDCGLVAEETEMPREIDPSAGVGEYMPSNSDKDSDCVTLDVLPAWQKMRHGESKPGEPLVSLQNKDAIAAACTILFEETKGRCELIMLAGKFKVSARRQIAAKLLGREAAHDEYGVSNLREQFRSAMGIDAKLTGDEAEAKIAERAIGIVKAIDASESAAAADAVSPGSSRLSDEEPVDEERVEDQVSEEPSGEQSAAGAAAEESIPANESTQEMKTKTKAAKAKSQHPKKAAKASNGKPHADGKRQKVFGEYGAGPFARWLGRKGVDFEHARKIVDRHGGKHLSDASLRWELKETREGRDPAKVSREHAEEVRGQFPEAFSKK